MAGALTPEQRAIVEATDKALDEFGKRLAYHHFKAQAPSPYVDPNDPRWYQGFKYEEAHIPTERLGVPTAPARTQRCECGSGSNEASGAHSHWCPRWVRP